MIKQTIRTSHKFYKKHDNCNLQLSDYSKINYEYCKFLINKLYDGEHIKLPSELGSVEIVGKKIEPEFSEDGTKIVNMAIDWKSTFEARSEHKDFTGVIHYMNSNTDGIRYKFFWHNANIKMNNQSLYSLQFCRRAKRTLAKLIKAGRRYKVRSNNSIKVTGK